MKKGLLMVYTGHGKGKTTAALGQVFRALGQGLRVCLIQFIKGSRKCGELVAAKRHKDLLEVHVLGRGFTWESADIQKDIEAAQRAWKFAKETIQSAKFQLVVLDEITYLMKYKIVNEQEVVDFLLTRPENMHVIITGRDAPRSLIEIADLVLQMKSIRHHYSSGIKAQRGIEF